MALVALSTCDSDLMQEKLPWLADRLGGGVLQLRLEALDLAAVLEKLVSMGRFAGFETAMRFYEVGSMTGINDLSVYLRKYD